MDMVRTVNQCVDDGYAFEAICQVIPKILHILIFWFLCALWSSTCVYTQVLNAWTKSASSVRVFVQVAKKLSTNPRVWARCEKDLEEGLPDDARFLHSSTFLCSPVARKLIPIRANYVLTGEFLGWAMDHVYIGGGPKTNMSSIGPFRWNNDATKYVNTC